MIVIANEALIGNVLIVLMPHSENSLTDSEHEKFYCRDDWSGFHTMIPGQHVVQGKEKTFFINEKKGRNRYWIPHFRGKISANLRLLEIHDITTRIFEAIYINTSLNFDWTIFG